MTIRTRGQCTHPPSFFSFELFRCPQREFGLGGKGGGIAARPLSGWGDSKNTASEPNGGKFEPEFLGGMLQSKKYPLFPDEERLFKAFRASLRVLVFLAAAGAAALPPMLLGPNLAERGILNILGLALEGLKIFLVIYILGWIIAAIVAVVARGTKVIAMVSRFPLVVCLLFGLAVGFCYGYLTFVHDGPPAL